MKYNPSPWAPDTITRHKRARRPPMAIVIDAAAVLLVIGFATSYFWEQLEPIFSLIGKSL